LTTINRFFRTSKAFIYLFIYFKDFYLFERERRNKQGGGAKEVEEAGFPLSRVGSQDPARA